MGSLHFRSCLLVVATFLLLQCSDKPSNPESPAIRYPFEQEIPIAVGETILFEGDELQLAFEQVNFDARCLPTGSCSWPDIAEIRLRVKVGVEEVRHVDVGIKSTSSNEAAEILRVDTLGYAFKLLNLSPDNDSLQLSAIQTGYIATILVSKAEAPRHFNGFSVQRKPSEEELAFSLPHRIVSAEAIGDTLVMIVEFDQGCRARYSDLYIDQVLTKNGRIVSAALWLRQVGGEDSCASLSISRELRFDISSIKELYARQFGAWECVSLLIQTATIGQQLGQPTTAIYGQCVGHYNPPVLTVASSFLIRALETSELEVSASDVDGDSIRLLARGLPANSQFVDHGNGTGTFQMTPARHQRGVHLVTFYAYDGMLRDSQAVNIVVTRPDLALNIPPVIGGVPPQSTIELDPISATIPAFDEDGDTLVFIGIDLPESSSLRDNHNGTANFDFTPSYFQSGIQIAAIAVSDGYLADTTLLQVYVANRNRHPYFRVLERGLVVKQTALLATEIEVGDDDNETIRFDFGDLPANATMTTIALNRYRLEFQPDTTQFGIFQIPLRISDGIDSARAEIAVQVADESSVIYFDPVDSIFMTEGEVLVVDVHAYSPQLGIDRMYTTDPDSFPHGVFSYLGNGIGRCTLSPTFVAAGKYRVSVTAVDRLEEKTIWLNITVLEAGDQPPRFSPDTLRFTIAEGHAMNKCLSAIDPDLETSSYFPIHMSDGASFGFSGTCENYVFQSTEDVLGVFMSQIGTSDPDIPEIVDTLTIFVSVVPLIHNSGPLMPGGIGTYWVYELRGYYGSPTIDSVAIVDSTRSDGNLWWILSKPLWLFGDRFAVTDESVTFANQNLTPVRSFRRWSTPGLWLTKLGYFERVHCYAAYEGFINIRRLYLYYFAEGYGLVYADEGGPISISIVRIHLNDTN